MKAWEKNFRRVEPYTPGEQPEFSDMIKLNTNENPYPPSPKVAEAAAGLCGETGKFRLYPDFKAGALVDALAGYYGLSGEQVFVGVGSDDVLSVAFLTFFNSGRPVLFHFMMFGRRSTAFRMNVRHSMGISGSAGKIITGKTAVS